jgi:hypothetical protein
MFASMIEAVIQPRLGKGAGVSPRNLVTPKSGPKTGVFVFF